MKAVHSKQSIKKILESQGIDARELDPVYGTNGFIEINEKHTIEISPSRVFPNLHNAPLV